MDVFKLSFNITTEMNYLQGKTLKFFRGKKLTNFIAKQVARRHFWQRDVLMIVSDFKRNKSIAEKK